jgi:nicotinate-nucleotide adenylyltransferase
MGMTRYAMYGGSFDPMHMGHLSIVERAIEMDYDVLVVPAFRHAFGKQSAPFEHRVRMCELALQGQRLQPQARVCALEGSLAHGQNAPVYTYDVLCALRARLQTAPCLLVGPDIAGEWERWYRHAEIDREFGRLCLPMTRPVRSSTIRQQLHDGIPLDTLHASLPESVRTYIEAEGLYH